MSDSDDRRAAFERLFAAHYADVRRYALRRAPAASVEDVVAETFLVAWRRLEVVGEDPVPWLLGVARRVLANQLRAERRRGALTGRLRAVGPERELAWEPPVRMGRELGLAIASLSAREREALLLVAWEGLEPARAARVAGCTPAAFRVRLHRARRHVSAALGLPADGGGCATIVKEVQ
ncbi:MAG: RNA polymerase sigma factor [Solirubrobacteraceae bacterium]